MAQKEQSNAGGGSRPENDRRPEAPKGVTVVADPKIGRNDACPCGSGKKYKKCCGGAETGG